MAREGFTVMMFFLGLALFAADYIPDILVLMLRLHRRYVSVDIKGHNLAVRMARLMMAVVPRGHVGHLCTALFV